MTGTKSEHLESQAMAPPVFWNQKRGAVESRTASDSDHPTTRSRLDRIGATRVRRKATPCGSKQGIDRPTAPKLPAQCPEGRTLRGRKIATNMKHPRPSKRSEPPIRRYPTMIRTVARGATRAARAADLARIEALETDDSWDGIADLASEDLRERIAHLDNKGADAELRREDMRLDPEIVT